MASDANNCGARLVGSFELLHQHFACTVVREPFIFNLGLIRHRFHEGINAADPHSLSLIRHLRLQALDDREVKGSIVQFSSPRVCVTGTFSEA